MPAYPLVCESCDGAEQPIEALAPPTLFVAGPKGDGASPHFRNGDRHRVFRRRIAGLALHNHRMGHVSMDWSPRKDQLGRVPPRGPPQYRNVSSERRWIRSAVHRPLPRMSARTLCASWRSSRRLNTPTFPWRHGSRTCLHELVAAHLNIDVATLRKMTTAKTPRHARMMGVCAHIRIRASPAVASRRGPRQQTRPVSSCRI